MNLFSRRQRDDDAAPAQEPADESHKDVFNLIPPRAEEFERPSFERPYGLHRPVDLDLARLEAVQNEREAPAPEAVVTLKPVETPVAETPPATPATLEPMTETPSPAAAVPAVTPHRNIRDGGMDLTRISIDNDGRLYWDGKPVEVRRRVSMSRAQVFGGVVVGVLLFIAAAGAALHGAVAAHQWGCSAGLIQSYCKAEPQPAPVIPQRFDFPA